MSIEDTGVHHHVVILFDRGATCTAHRLPQGRVGLHLRERIGEGVGIARTHEPAFDAVGDELTDAGQRGRHDGTTDRQALGQEVGEPVHVSPSGPARSERPDVAPADPTPHLL